MLTHFQELTYRTKSILFSVILVSVTLAIFSQVRHFEFVNYDDNLFVRGNPHIQNGFTGESVRWALTVGLTHQSPHCDYWQPLTFFSRMLDIQLFGLNSAAHHTTNLLIHCFNVLILFFLLASLTHSPGKSFFATALFAIHPVQAEVVAWVTARKDVLSGCFALLAITTYVRSRTQRTWSIPFYSLSCVLYLFAMLSKPIPMFPFLLLLFDIWPLEREESFRAGSRPAAKLFAEKLPFFMISLLSFTAVTTQKTAISDWSFGRALMSYSYYLRNMFCPFGLGIYDPSAASGAPLEMEMAFAGGLLVIGISFWVIRRVKESRFWLAGWLLFLIGLLPTSGSKWPEDRFLYLPMIGWTAAFVWGIGEWMEAHPAWKKVGIGTAAVLLTALILLTIRQASYWKNSKALFARALALNPDNIVALNTLAEIFVREGRFKEAEAYFQKSISLNRTHPRPFAGLSVLLASQGKTEEAIHYTQEAIHRDPALEALHSNLGYLLRSIGKIDEAIQSCQTALEINPEYVPALINMGEALTEKNEWEEAASYFLKALRIQPDSMHAHAGLQNLEALRRQNQTQSHETPSP